MAAPGPYRRPITIQKSQGNLRIGIVVGSLAELKEKGAPMFGLEPSNCRVQLEGGAEVLDEECFSDVETDAILIMRPCKRLIKIQNSQDPLTIDIFVGSLAELKEEGAPKFGLEPSNCRVQRRNGTQVLDEEYFSYVEEGTTLTMIADYNMEF